MQPCGWTDNICSQYQVLWRDSECIGGPHADIIQTCTNLVPPLHRTTILPATTCEHIIDLNITHNEIHNLILNQAPRQSWQVEQEVAVFDAEFIFRCIHPSIHLSVVVSFYLSIYLYIYISMHLSIDLAVKEAHGRTRRTVCKERLNTKVLHYAEVIS